MYGHGSFLTHQLIILIYTVDMRHSAFEVIPGIGTSLASDLDSLGYKVVQDLRGENPEEMYDRLQAQVGTHVDRCVLYTFRCAVYYAAGGRDPEKLKWWNWKD